MGPLPYGPSTAHVNASHGPDVNINQFYITEYSNKFGTEGFLPRAGKHKGTGYQSNFRPGIYYSRKLDELDNPRLGKLLADNYNSTTKIHFKGSRGSDGKDPLPHQVHMVKSGFVKDTQPTVPSTKQVKSVFVDTKYEGTVYPKILPQLHKIRSKDPIALENAGYGPSFLSTESHSNYKGAQLKAAADPLRSSGNKEESGFTHAFNDEPITFKPNDAHNGDYPGWYTWRPTGISMMKGDFRPSRYLNGKDPFTTVTARADRDTGYTREIKPSGEFTGRPEQVFTKLEQVQPLVQERIRKKDPAEYANMVHAKEYPSMSTTAFKGLQSEKETLSERLGNLSFGNKEDTGYTENNAKYLKTLESPASLQRYNTEYQTRYFDKTPKAEARMGNTKGDVMDQPENGFTKSTAVHCFGSNVDTSEQLKKLHPYVARSIKARDPYYATQSYENKKKPLIA